MATALTVPLDDWVVANSRPVKTGAMDTQQALGSRRDYSSLTVDEAFSLLYHTCKARFGDLKALDFDVRELEGPLAYSSTLTVTGPDDIGIEFQNSGRHPTAITAKMHAAYHAVQQGVIAFLLQDQASAVAAHPSLSPVEPKKSPIRGNALEPPPNLQQPLPKKPNLGPSIGIPVDPKAKSTGDKPRPAAPAIKPTTKPPTTVDKSPVSILNELLQKVYSAKKLHKQANTGLRWEQKRYNEGYLARMTVVLPSGASKSYGSVPESLPPNYQQSKYPLKPEKVSNLAKRAVASYAIKLGVVDFITSEDVTGRALASVGLPPRSAPTTSNHPVATGSNSVQLKVPPVQPGKLHDLRASALKNTISYEPPGSDIHPDVTAPKQPSSAKTPPVDKVRSANTTHPSTVPSSKSNPELHQAVDDEREPGQISPGRSPKISNEIFNAHVQSHHPIRERLGSYEPLGDEDEQSQCESMELDSETRGDSVVSDTERKVSLEPEMEESGDEPPRKKLKTDSMVSEKAPSPEEEAHEKMTMSGASYVDILSMYCVENKLPQPQVTYQRQLGESNKNTAVLYHVSFVIGTRRYELSKHYESVQSAEEKLSKRILKLFGVQAKKT